MKNNKHFKGRSIEFFLELWRRDQNFYINLNGGSKNFIKYMRMSSTPFPQIINYPYLMLKFLLDVCIAAGAIWGTSGTEHAKRASLAKTVGASYRKHLDGGRQCPFDRR